MSITADFVDSASSPTDGPHEAVLLSVMTVILLKGKANINGRSIRGGIPEAHDCAYT